MCCFWPPFFHDKSASKKKKKRPKALAFRERHAWKASSILTHPHTKHNLVITLSSGTFHWTRLATKSMLSSVLGWHRYRRSSLVIFPTWYHSTVPKNRSQEEQIISSVSDSVCRHSFISFWNNANVQNHRHPALKDRYQVDIPRRIDSNRRESREKVNQHKKKEKISNKRG